MEEVIVNRISTTVPVFDTTAVHTLTQILAELKSINQHLTVLASPPSEE
jgi:hypothetical protein